MGDSYCAGMPPPLPKEADIGFLLWVARQSNVVRIGLVYGGERVGDYSGRDTDEALMAEVLALEDEG